MSQSIHFTSPEPVARILLSATALGCSLFIMKLYHPTIFSVFLVCSLFVLYLAFALTEAFPSASGRFNLQERQKSFLNPKASNSMGAVLNRAKRAKAGKKNSLDTSSRDKIYNSYQNGSSVRTALIRGLWMWPLIVGVTIMLFWRITQPWFAFLKLVVNWITL